MAVVGTGEGAGGVHDGTNEVGSGGEAAVGGGISPGTSGGSE